MAGNIINTGTTVDLTGLRNLRVELETLKRQYADISKSSSASINQLIDIEKQLAAAVASGSKATVAAYRAAADAQRVFTSEAVSEQIKVENQIKRVKEAMDSLSESGEKAAKSFVGVIPGFGVAAERFISIIPGLGTVLEKAFPLFGAIAFGEVIVRIGEQVFKLAEKWDPLTRAIKESTEEAKKFDQQVKSIKESIIATDLKTYTKAYGDVAGSAKQIADSVNQSFLDTRRIQAIQLQITDAQQKANATRIEEGIVLPAGTREQQGAVKDLVRLTRELDVAQREKAQHEKESAYEAVALNAKFRDERIKREEEAIEAGKRAAEEEKRLALARRAEIARQQEAAFRERQALEEENDKILSKVNSEIVLGREREIKRETQTLYEESQERLRIARQEASEEKRIIEQRRQDIQTSGAIGEAGIGVGRAGAQAGKARSDGSLFGSTASQDVAYLQAIKELDRQLIEDKVQTQLKLVQLDSLNSPEKVQADIRKIVEIQKQGQVTMLNDQTAILNREQQQYKKFFGQLNSDATRAFKDLLVNPKNFVADLNQIWVKMVTDFADKLLLMGLQWVENEAFMLLVHTTSKEAEVGVDASVAAQKKAINLTTTLAELNADAVKAAAGAYAAVVGIPYVGPFLAPPAAAAAYAGVIALGALGSFETGTDYVPKTGLYQLHQGEAVIPKNQNGGAMSVTQHINGANHSPEQIAAMSLSGIQSFARRSNWVPG